MRLMQLNPKPYREYNLKKRRKYKLILADFEDALYLEPDNDLYWYQTGLFVQDVGGAEIYGDDYINLSIPYFTNAINLNSKDHKYFYSRAISYQISKNMLKQLRTSICNISTSIKRKTIKQNTLVKEHLRKDMD